MRAHRPSRGARGACFPLLKALLLLRGSSFLLKVSSLLLKALLLFQSSLAGRTVHVCRTQHVIEVPVEVSVEVSVEGSVD